MNIKSSLFVVGTSASNSEVSIVQKSFGGRAETLSTCDNCGYESKRVDSFKDLSLSFPNNNDKQTVQNLLSYYLQPETLCGDNQYHCDKCQGLTDGKKTTAIVKTPEYLILTLKHFQYNQLSQRRTKTMQHVTLDENVVLENISYTLYAAVYHFGHSAESGHYYTVAKHGTDWFKFNDDHVMKIRASELKKPEQPEETAYILFYNRQDCVEPELLSINDLASQLKNLVKAENNKCEDNDAEFDVLRHQRKDDDPPPPPPGCGNFSNFNNTHNKFIY